MNSKQRYFLTGLFVVITVMIAIGIAVWFSVSNREEFNTYLAKFHEAAEGVTVGSSVRYNGVIVGSVKSIELDNMDPRVVNVLLNIYTRIKVNVDTYAQIKSQGITGMSYIDLKLPDNANQRLSIIPHNTKPYPVIATKVSLLSKISDNAQIVSANVEKITDKINTAFNPYNIEHLSNILTNLDKISLTIANRSKAIDQSMASVAQILKSVAEQSKRLDSVLQNTNGLINNLNNTTKGINNMVGSVNGSTIPNINNVLIPNLNQSFVNLRKITNQLDDFLELLNQNPAILLRGKSAGALGPGE